MEVAVLLVLACSGFFDGDQEPLIIALVLADHHLQPSTAIFWDTPPA